MKKILSLFTLVALLSSTIHSMQAEATSPIIGWRVCKQNEEGVILDQYSPFGIILYENQFENQLAAFKKRCAQEKGKIILEIATRFYTNPSAPINRLSDYNSLEKASIIEEYSKDSIRLVTSDALLKESINTIVTSLKEDGITLNTIKIIDVSPFCDADDCGDNLTQEINDYSITPTQEIDYYPPTPAGEIAEVTVEVTTLKFN